LFVPKSEILPRPQRILWDELQATPRSFVLYGGTGLALRLGHRESEDFDFFSTKPFDPQELLSQIPYLTNATIVQFAKNTFTSIVERQGRVKLSLFWGT
jgi:hypothetical protein